MSVDIRKSRQALVSSWVAQLIGTLVLAGVVLVFVRSAGAPFATEATEWKRYAFYGVMLGAIPPLLYLRHYKRLLDSDERAERQRGSPDPALRSTLAKALLLGGALCEVPMAMGVLQLFFGGETRGFLLATMVTIAMRLSYRPFTRTK